jgi:hypothetical protein
MVTRTSRLLVLLSIVTLPLVLLPTAPVTAQAPAPHAAEPAAQSSMGMMKMHENMSAEMQAADGRLDALVKTMNAAAGDAKTNAIAAVVSELVAQHKQMHVHMTEMHQQMMGGRGMMMKP